MKNLNSFDCCSLKTNLLVDVCFDTIMAGLALPLIYAIDFLGGGGECRADYPPIPQFPISTPSFVSDLQIRGRKVFRLRKWS